ncbi:hypothetical protein F2P45_07590 [Massilia sp. CCM 8733]|uniref:Uncharacterized protein n=1 Tax=Massilia mucilaginosa TaxID=2609282 RepID=A0ABX0NQ27_9BURK|nr:hypothetical protein [Massilia mucilaginosa]NHZ88886.1 hypothetical protein [Massilia mucilaginosa]
MLDIRIVKILAGQFKVTAFEYLASEIVDQALVGREFRILVRKQLDVAVRRYTGSRADAASGNTDAYSAANEIDALINRCSCS